MIDTKQYTHDPLQRHGAIPGKTIIGIVIFYNIYNYFTFLYTAQLNEIKKQGMSALLCRSYKIKDIQRNPFLQMKNG